MAKDSYGRSLLWYLAFFGLPVAAFALMFLEIWDWENPTWGPQLREVAESAPEQLKEEEPKPQEAARKESRPQEPEKKEETMVSVYERTALILAAIGALPYLILLVTLSERLRITDKSIQQVRLFTNRRVMWDNLIECRDLLNYIHLVPTDRSSEIYIDYYQTFRRHAHLRRLITRKSGDVEANMMVGRRRGRVASCDLGLVPSLLFVAAAAILVLTRQGIVLLGVLCGIVLALVGACVWITTRLSARSWKSGGSVYLTLFALSLILPPAFFAQKIDRLFIPKVTEAGAAFMAFLRLFSKRLSGGEAAFVVFVVLYFVGLMAGSGLISTLLPSRKRRHTRR